MRTVCMRLVFAKVIGGQLTTGHVNAVAKGARAPTRGFNMPNVLRPGVRLVVFSVCQHVKRSRDVSARTDNIPTRTKSRVKVALGGSFN